MNFLRFQLPSLYHTKINSLRPLHVDKVFCSAVLVLNVNVWTKIPSVPQFVVHCPRTLDNLQNGLRLLVAKSRSPKLADRFSGSETTCEVVELPLLQLQMQPPPFVSSCIKRCEYKLSLQYD